DATLAGRRIVFQSGRAVTRQYEIVSASVALSSVTVCVDLDDAWSLGQRLAPHATLGARTLPPVRHPQPAAGPSEACLESPGQPSAFGCCTGPGTGDCVEALPTIRGLNFGQRPGPFRSPYAAVQFTARRAGQVMQPFEYNNIHDQSSFAPVLFGGVQNSTFRWNAIHDDGARATPTQSGLYLVQSEPERGACGCGANDNL